MKECITTYHIKLLSRKQLPKPALEEGEVPPPTTSKRRNYRRTQSAGARASAAATAELDTDTDTDDAEAAMVQSALHQSLLEASRSPAGKGRGRKSGPCTVYYQCTVYYRCTAAMTMTDAPGDLFTRHAVASMLFPSPLCRYLHLRRCCPRPSSLYLSRLSQACQFDSVTCIACKL